MFHSLRSIVFASIVAVSAPLAVGSVAQADASHACTAKITRTQARHTALKRVPGKVVSLELEREHGRCIYSFEIRPKGEKGKLVKEVNVNAETGKIVNVETERHG